MFGEAILMMGKTEIVTAFDQIHACLQCEQATSGMTGFARQAGQPFPERSIQALDKSGVQDAATMGEQQQCLRLGHLTRDLDYPLLTSVRLITVPMCTSGQTCKQARPTPLVCLIFSRNARRMLPGYAFQPSVNTSRGRSAAAHRRTC